MQIAPTPDLTGVGLLQLSQVDGQHDLTRPEIEDVGTQFEGVFMSLLIKELRESMEGGMFEGENSDTYGALFDLYLGQHMAEAGGLGIKQMLVARYSEANAGAQ